MSEEQDITYPSIVCKIKGGLYAVDSRYITTLIQKPAAEKLPEGPDFMSGIFHYRGTIVQMLDMRRFLGLQSVQQEVDDFVQMIEQRKKDHVNWVNSLEHSLKTGEVFTLATDPHKCAFGQWYDHFHTDNQALKFALSKIDRPHTQLHKSAVTVLQKKDETLVKQIHTELVPEIMQLMQELETAMHDFMHHEMVLVLSGDSQLGLVVDEILAVSELAPAQPIAKMESDAHSCISGVMRDAKTEELILEVDIPQLLEIYKQRKTPISSEETTENRGNL